MTLITNDENLSIELYHGTSTLFLDSIIKNGLGGINLIEEWKVLELAKEVYNLSEKHLKDLEFFKISSYSFKNMVNQDNSGSLNFQHGQTYISASKLTATKYAMSNEFGSELLTYTIKFLRKLIELRIEIEYVTKNLYQEYKKIFDIIEARPSPLLISIQNINASLLLSEHGKSSKANLDQISDCLIKDQDFDIFLQQTNFRLSQTININSLKLEFINIIDSRSHSLYEINPIVH